MFIVAVYKSNGWLHHVFEFTDKDEAQAKYDEENNQSDHKVIKNFE